MTDKPRIPVFVERKTYRRRRMADAARLLPIFGALLFCMPLLWSVGDPPKTTLTMFYLFLVWFTLFIASALISRQLSDQDRGSQPGAEDEGH
jgi:hypothetical protein